MLTSVTPSYRDYLNCFGMPGFVVSLIMGAGENIKVQDHSNGSITIETITGTFLDIIYFAAAIKYSLHYYSAFETRKLTVDEGKEFRFPWGRGKGVMHNTMVRPKPNVLFFSAWEPVKLWNLTSEMVFTKYGMINTRRFVNENVTAKKYYQVNQLVTQVLIRPEFQTENSSRYQENLKQKSVLVNKAVI